MKLRLLLIAALLAVSGVLALASCNTSPTASCSYASVQLSKQFGIDMGQGDTTYVAASTLSDCPTIIGPAVTFTTNPPNIVSLLATSDTTVRVIAVNQGSTYLVATSRDQPSIQDSVAILVFGPNP